MYAYKAGDQDHKVHLAGDGLQARKGTGVRLDRVYVAEVEGSQGIKGIIDDGMKVRDPLAVFVDE